MKQAGAKARVLAVLEVLKDRTDAEHGICLKEIRKIVKEKMLLDALPDRKTIGQDIHALEDLGYVIETERQGNDFLYYLKEREFSPFELHLMADAVASSKFLSLKTANELIRKLKQFTSVRERESISRQIVLTERINDNDRIHISLQTIQRAVAANQQITYRYTYYDENKQKQRRPKKYQVSPWAVIYADNNYYLLAYEAETGLFKHYRVDRMEIVSVLLDSQREGQDAFKKIQLRDYQKKVFSMYGGEVKSVTLQFSNDMMNVAIDRFGKVIVPQRVDDKHFKITVPVAVSPQFYGWLVGLGEGVKIVEPEDIKDRFIDYMSNIQKKYL